MEISKTVKRIAAEYGISLKKMSTMSGMTEAGFYNAIKNNTLKLSTWDKIANALKISPSVIFDSSLTNDNKNQPQPVHILSPLQQVSANKVFIDFLEQIVRNTAETAINTAQSTNHTEKINKYFELTHEHETKVAEELKLFREMLAVIKELSNKK